MASYLAARAPSQYPRCRRKQCEAPPVADLNRKKWTGRAHRVDDWWAYCAPHLAEYSHYVIHGEVIIVPKRHTE